MIQWSFTVLTTHKRADLAVLDALAAAQAQAETQAPTLTRSRLKALFESGKVTADEKPLKANSKLREGMTITLELPPLESMELVPEEQNLEILFEDEHLLVLNKPPGLTVHPSPTQRTGTLVHGLLHQIKNLSGIGGVLRPGIVHRIDKNTSGALVITKSDLAHTRLAQAFAVHDIERSYWALCYSSPDSTTRAADSRGVRIESKIGRHPTDRKKMSMTATSDAGRTAITYYRKEREYCLPSKKPFASFLIATLETGRTHQVRVHLAGIGHSILGDPTYGPPTEKHPKWLALPAEVREIVSRLPGQALHARVLGFKHPITGAPLRFEAEPPTLFRDLMAKLNEGYS